MPPIIHLDYETFSAANLPDVGAYRYAADPSSEILMMAVALDDDEPMLFVPELYECEGMFTDPALFRMLAKYLPREDVEVYAHNAQFEIAITKYLWETTFGKLAPPRLNQWRCTAAMSRRAALRYSLAGIGEDLKLADQKSKSGTDLIKRFSVPQKITKKQTEARIYPWDDPAAFAEFGRYCLQDVVTERGVHRALKAFEIKGSSLDTFQLDQRINDRGIPVNLDAIRKAKVIVDSTQARFAKQFRELVGLNQTQREKVKAWLVDRGYPFENMQAQSVEDALDHTEWANGDDDALTALRLYSDLSYAAVSKLQSMMACECGDKYVRGTLLYYGAGTGRWSGQLIQPQNFKRATIKGTDEAYRMICEGCTEEELELVFGNPIEVISSCIRHFIQPHTGNFFQADYAAIEARIVCWLAGQEDALDQYRRGADRYVTMATKIYGCKESEVTKDMRFVGKQAVLGCGFQMWWPAFQKQCAKYGQEVDDETSELAVVTFRDVHHKVAKLWKLADDAAKEAINNPGRWIPAGDKIAFARTHIKSTGKDFLFLRLPSGRMLAYPEPAIAKVKKKVGGKAKLVDQITFYGQLPKSKFWGRISTYGGKLVENATQATAGDLMANGSVEAEKRGFEIVTLIHDEAIAYEHDHLTLQDFCDALCTLPEWAKGLPLVAEGNVIPYYLKA